MTTPLKAYRVSMARQQGSMNAREVQRQKVVYVTAGSETEAKQKAEAMPDNLAFRATAICKAYR